MNAVNLTLLTDKYGKKFWATAEQAQAIEQLTQVRKGTIGTVHGYIPSTNWIEKPTQDINFICRFSYTKLLERKLAAINAITLADIKADVANDEKLSVLSESKLQEVFDTRKAKEVASIENSLKSETEKVKNNHHLAHETFYAYMADGVKVHLETEQGENGKQLVEMQNLPVAKSIMVNYLELNVTTIKEGQRKVVNSGAPVRISKLIAKQLNTRSVGFKTMSLKQDNFKSIKVAKGELTTEQTKNLGDLLLG